jgi:hypothetical protein
MTFNPAICVVAVLLFMRHWKLTVMWWVNLRLGSRTSVCLSVCLPALLPKDEASIGRSICNGDNLTFRWNWFQATATSWHQSVATHRRYSDSSDWIWEHQFYAHVVAWNWLLEKSFLDVCATLWLNYVGKRNQLVQILQVRLIEAWRGADCSLCVCTGYIDRGVRGFLQSIETQASVMCVCTYPFWLTIRPPSLWLCKNCSVKVPAAVSDNSIWSPSLVARCTKRN